MAIFVRVAESGSFSAVARERGVTQPAISRQIASLEEHLGARLVQRTTRRVGLTEDGRDCLGPAKSVLEAVEQAESAVGVRQGGVSGLVRVSCPAVFGRLIIAPRINVLLQRHAGLSVDLVHESSTDLVHDAVDLAIQLGTLPTDGSFVMRRIGSISQVIAGAPAYLDVNPMLVHPSDLVHHHCIIDDRAPHREVWTMTRHAGPGQDETGQDEIGPDGVFDAQVGGRFRTDNSDSKHEAVLSGLGLAMLSKWLIRHELRRGTLRVVLPEWQFAPIPIHAVYPSKRNLPPRVRAVLDFLIDEMSNIPDLSNEAPS